MHKICHSIYKIWRFFCFDGSFYTRSEPYYLGMGILAFVAGGLFLHDAYIYAEDRIWHGMLSLLHFSWSAGAFGTLVANGYLPRHLWR